MHIYSDYLQRAQKKIHNPKTPDLDSGLEYAHCLCEHKGERGRWGWGWRDMIMGRKNPKTLPNISPSEPAQLHVFPMTLMKQAVLCGDEYEFRCEVRLPAD